jgi:hypothetical protein
MPEIESFIISENISESYALNNATQQATIDGVAFDVFGFNSISLTLKAERTTIEGDLTVVYNQELRFSRE